MAKDNKNVLDIAVDQIKTPKDLPSGVEYEFALTGYTPGESPDKKTPYVDIKARAVKALSDDVPGDVEADYWPVTHRFWATEKAIGQLKRFLTGTLGLSEKDKTGNVYTIRELLEEATGLAFWGVVGTEMRGKNKDREQRILESFRPAQD